MTKKKLQLAVEIFLIFLILGGIFLVYMPVYRQTMESLERAKNQFFSMIEDVSGLSISYSSMSPSIFKQITLRDVEVHDVSSGTRLLFVRNFSVKYNPAKLIGEKPYLAFEEFFLNSGTLAWSDTLNDHIAERISKFGGGGDGSFSGKNSEDPGTNVSPVSVNPEEGASKEISEEIISGLLKEYDTPIKITVKNFTGEYRTSGGVFSVGLDLLSGSLGNSGCILETKGSAGYKAFETGGLTPVNSFFTISLFSDSSLKEGTLNLVIDRINFPGFSLEKIKLLGAYNNGRMEFRTVQNLVPVEFVLIADLNSRFVDLSFQTENASPFSFISINRSANGFSGLRDVTVSGEAHFILEDFKTPSYNCDFSVYLPSTLIPGSGNAEIALEGNNQQIDVNKMEVNTGIGNARYEGVILIPGPESGPALPVVPEGTLFFSGIALPSGATAGGELYIEKSGGGCYLFLPELAVGEALFSALELNLTPGTNSIDFSFNGMNFDAIDYGLMGNITADGVIITEDDGNYIELYGGVDSLSASAIIKSIEAFLPRSFDRSIIPDLSPMALTTEVYFTSDMENTAFNCTRLIFADVTDDSKYLLLSASGNGSSFKLENVSMGYGNLTLGGDFAFETTLKDIMFSSNLYVNNIPYSLNGMVQDGNRLSVYGDYGLYVSAVKNPGKAYSGKIILEGLPIPAGEYIPAITTDTDFYFFNKKDWLVTINNLSATESSGLMPVVPYFSSKGGANPGGFYLEEMSYQDDLSSLLGGLSVSWDMESSLRLIQLNGNLSDEEGRESVSIDVMLSNSGGGSFYSRDKMFISCNTAVRSFPFGRFIRGQSPSDSITGDFILSGTPDSLFANLNIENVSVKIGEMILLGDLQAVLEENEIFLSSFNLSYGGQYLKDFSGSFSLTDFSADINGDYAGSIGRSDLSSKIDISMTATENQSLDNMLNSAEVSVLFSEIKLSGEDLEQDLPVQLNRKKGRTELFAGVNRGFSCTLFDDMRIMASGSPGTPFVFNLSGSLNADTFFLDVRDVDLDLSKTWKFLGLPEVVFEKGHIFGDFAVGGFLFDPEFSGDLYALNTVMILPDYIDEKFGPFDVNANISGNTISLGPVVIQTSETKTNVWTEVQLIFDRWKFGDVIIDVSTMQSQEVKAAVKLLGVEIDGKASCDLNLKINPSRFDISGNILLNDGSICLSNNLETESDSQDIDVLCDLTISLGPHVDFLYPSKKLPVIRATLRATEDFNFQMDGTKGAFYVKGAADLKGGEIFYFRRNFYLREGRIEVNGNQNNFDPIISLSAEIRERDNKENVKIILSAENQRLSTLVPRISSVPPRSEAEIMALLARITVSDVLGSTSTDSVSLSWRDVVASTSDIFTQMGITRVLEQKLMDVLHLDLFSMRTMLLQNAILYAGSKEEIKPGNFLDGTTVYIGKYLGSNIYLDGMFHLYYDENSPATDTWGGLRFQLESGLEMNTPFFDLRWKFAPQLDTFRETYGVPDTSISLSWSFTY